MIRIFSLFAFLAVLLTGLPLLGILVAGKDVSQYWQFPPLTTYIDHAPFSLPLFIILTIFALLVALLFILQVQPFRSEAAGKTKTTDRHPFPWWGILGGLLTLISWILAWNRFSWFAPFQVHTFLPLWLGYILVINGLTYRRRGSCLLIDRTGYFLSLFPVSSGFWWFFEYLNRFVQNWHYLGIENFSAGAYIGYASLSFSTVLPAVLCTEELFSTFERLTRPLQSSYRLGLPRSRLAATTIFLASAVGLAAIGVWPDVLFPLLWLAPLILAVTIQKGIGQVTFMDAVSQGDWRPVWLPALAALFCGFFWEMWNVNSYAHWVYSIPFVEKGHIFEMPVLGYLGYLPFGLECKAVGSLWAFIFDNFHKGRKR